MPQYFCSFICRANLSFHQKTAYSSAGHQYGSQQEAYRSIFHSGVARTLRIFRFFRCRKIFVRRLDTLLQQFVIALEVGQIVLQLDHIVTGVLLLISQTGQHGCGAAERNLRGLMFTHSTLNDIV